MSLRNESLLSGGGDTIIRSETRILSALSSIDDVKAEMVLLKAQVDASVVAADGLYSVADQTEVAGVITALKAQVVAHAASL